MSRRKKSGEQRQLNKYTASPDGKCEWCMEPSAFIECDTCVQGVAVDKAVRLVPKRKAKFCGHPSVDYFYCPECRPMCPSDLTGDLYKFCRQVQSFDMRKIGASNANGTLATYESKITQKFGTKDTRKKRQFAPRKRKRSEDPEVGAHRLPGDKWGAKISIEGREAWIGTFDTKEEAQDAYQAKRVDVDGLLTEFDSPFFCPDDDAVQLNNDYTNEGEES